MLEQGDAALIIGDKALVWNEQAVGGEQDSPHGSNGVQKIDLGEAWTSMTGLPFVWAFWAGQAGILNMADVEALQTARDAGLKNTEAIARDYFRDAPQRQALGAKYLRDNIKYHLGAEERAGLDLFYRYAAELDLAPMGNLRFYR
jgi:chorismate dehydratase